MNHDQETQELRQKHANLAEEAEPDSDERTTYSKIVEAIDRGTHFDTPITRLQNTQLHLKALAQTLDSPNGRKIVRAALRELIEMTDINFT